MEDMISFGQTLRTLRLKKGLSQEKLSELINVSLKTVQRWELNKRQPRIEIIKRLADILGVTEQDLLASTPKHGWRLTVRVAQDFREEVIDMTEPMPLVSTITTTKDGGLLTLGGNYSNWVDDKAFNSLVADLYRLRSTVIQNGRALGGIKD